MNKFQKGEILEPILILIGLVIVFVLFVLPQSKKVAQDNLNTNRGPAWGGSNEVYSNSAGSLSKNSLYENTISLSPGNASYADDPSEEYISLYNYGSEPVTISGWRLRNNKDARPVQINYQPQFVAADEVVIPNGTAFLSASGANYISPIVLSPGEEAILTTGSLGDRSDVPIVSFKENKCTGYLEAAADYIFTPSLSQNCSVPTKEPGYEYLDDECQDFISDFSWCHTPKFGTKDRDGNRCDNCVDEYKGLTRSCIVYLKNHYNYGSCMAIHSHDHDFSGRTWRVFLGNKWELWTPKREVIKLIDQFGKLIDYVSY